MQFRNCRALWQSAAFISNERDKLNFFTITALSSKSSTKSNSDVIARTADWFSNMGVIARVALKEARLVTIKVHASEFSSCNSPLTYFNANDLTSSDNSSKDLLSASLITATLAPLPILMK